MKCGEFPAKAKNLVTIQQRTDTSDAFGGSGVVWSTLQTAWAVIEPTSGREPYLQAQLQSRVTSKITIRYIAALKNTASAAKFRVLFDGRYFPIKYVKNLDEDLVAEGKVFQVLMCEENDAEN